MTRPVRALLAVGLLFTLVLDAHAARPWGWLGVRIRDLSEREMEDLSVRHGIREGFGVVIVDVLEDTPAARSGLRTGDIVVAIDGRPVTETRLLQRLIATAAPDAEVRLVVLRNEGRRALPVRLMPMPRDVAGDRVAALFGFALRDPASADAPAGGASTPVVSGVERGGPADRSGLQAGDVVLQVADRPVITREAARDALADMNPDRTLPLVVRRGAEQVHLSLKPSPNPAVPH